MKPIVVYHPSLNGEGISATDPVVVEQRKVGMIMNTLWDGKLRAESWIDVKKANKVDERIMESLEAGNMMEVSTGLFTDNEQTPGEFGEAKEPYVAIARNYRPDHLALLPDKIGACSIADGAGMLQVLALSHSNVHSALQMQVRARFGDDSWLADVYPSFVIYEHNDKLWKLAYTMSDTEVGLDEGEPMEVVRVTEYRTVSGDFVGNTTNGNFPRKEFDMPRSKSEQAAAETVVDSLIGNEQTRWEEGDKETLLAMNDETLAKLEPVVVENAPRKLPPKTDPVQVAATEGGKAVGPPGKDLPPDATENKDKPVTVESYVANAPPEVAEVLNAGLQQVVAQRAQLSAVVVANEDNAFTPDELVGMSLSQLGKLATLARKKEDPVSVGAPATETPISFVGAAGATPPVGNVGGEEPYVAPVMNYDTD